MSMKITSPAFTDGEPIPVRFTCDGDDVSPPLRWEGIPDDTQTLALVVEDPDAPDPVAPQTVFAHWLVYNMAPDSGGLVENVGAEKIPRGSRIGRNDFERAGYSGPCPPIGEHRYFFKLYALDSPLPTSRPLTRTTLLDAIEGHVLGYAELVGTYRKKHHKSAP